MIIKFIKCEVLQKNKELFSHEQEKWSSIKSDPGFIGQIGGWNKNSQTEAVILSFWKDKKFYNQFMNNRHDFIYNHQRDLLHSINVEIFNGVKSDSEYRIFLNKIDKQLLHVVDNIRETYKEIKMLISNANNQLELFICNDDRLAIHSSTTIMIKPEWTI
ncbi:DUF4937 domain-containing protein [Bacillus carboniphilus]|uniref:DUF4937 domain-containing protein n=1 Tax=Bacillus carboniphilus TaxID=86663 RepID=A0ABY9JUC2_9BACI|nr:DUF4937 domain-containing protein [Bacillus carboniphilus]WLR43011.1 DUF4937 domain-containing protein [Bacillus carboniphilus]